MWRETELVFQIMVKLNYYRKRSMKPTLHKQAIKKCFVHICDVIPTYVYLGPTPLFSEIKCVRTPIGHCIVQQDKSHIP